MTQNYAAGTGVSIDRSRVELEALLKRHHATGFVYGWQETAGMLVAFELRGRRIRFLVRPPAESELSRLRHAAIQRRAKRSDSQLLLDEEMKRRWRELILLVKAKLIAIQSGAVIFEEEFAPYILLPDGRTVAEHVIPMIESAYDTGRVPRLLPDFGGSDD